MLSAALLARQGHEVTIIDREPALGGLLGSVRHGAHWFDHGTHIPQETGHPALDELLFAALEPAEWQSIDVVRAGHVFRAALDSVSPFPSLAALGASAHDRAVVELLERSAPAVGHQSSADELRATFGPTITELVFRRPGRAGLRTGAARTSGRAPTGSCSNGSRPSTGRRRRR